MQTKITIVYNAWGRERYDEAHLIPHASRRYCIEQKITSLKMTALALVSLTSVFLLFLRTTIQSILNLKGAAYYLADSLVHVAVVFLILWLYTYRERAEAWKRLLYTK
jgi:hypothetical protein